MMSSQINRRESFRLEDTLKLRIRMLDDASHNAIVADFDGFRLRYCLKSHAQNQMDIHQPKLMQIRKRNPDIAQYLEYLELRLMQLSEQIEKLNSAENEADALEFVAHGDISAAGIKFVTAAHFSEGQMLEIGLVLSTSSIQVVMLGRVVRVDEREDGKMAVSIAYTQLHSEDKESIVRHLVKLQQKQLRESRMG